MATNATTGTEYGDVVRIPAIDQDLDSPDFDRYFVLADRIIAQADRRGMDGITPSVAASYAHCSTNNARRILNALVKDRELDADYRGAWTRYYSRRAR